jgi:hypothetical protein
MHGGIQALDYCKTAVNKKLYSNKNFNVCNNIFHLCTKNNQEYSIHQKFAKLFQEELPKLSSLKLLFISLFTDQTRRHQRWSRLPLQHLQNNI